MSISILSIQNLTYSHNLTASFPRGWTAVAGPNGSGKSTLLMLLGGLPAPDSGEIIRPGRALYVHQVPRDSEFFGSSMTGIRQIERGESGSYCSNTNQLCL